MRSVELRFTWLPFFMYLLYLDDAGSANNPNEEYLVLGGISVHESQVAWITKELDNLANSVGQNPHDIEFHASEIFSQRNEPWRSFGNKDDVRGMIKSVLKILDRLYDTARVFAYAIHKNSFPGQDPIKLAFEDLCSRFNLFLKRVNNSGDRHSGMIILDESSHETSLQSLARDFRQLGTQWGDIRHLCETPLFVNSKASRVVQLADHIAYAVFRYYNAEDAQYFNVFSHKFDQDNGVIHGLVHKQTFRSNCMCLACHSRRLSSSNQPG